MAERTDGLVWTEVIKQPKDKAGVTQGGEDDREGGHRCRGSKRQSRKERCCGHLADNFGD